MTTTGEQSGSESFPIESFLGTLLFGSLFALVLDMIYLPEQYIYTGPLGMIWVWSPGMTVAYAMFLFWMVRYLRGADLS